MTNRARDLREDMVMCFLDVIKYDDVEWMSGVLKLLNNDGCFGWTWYFGRTLTIEDVIPAAIEARRRGWVRWLQVPASGSGYEEVAPEQVTDPNALWFHLLLAGREALMAWVPPIEPIEP